MRTQLSFMFVLISSLSIGQSISIKEISTQLPIQYAHVIYYEGNEIVGGPYSDKVGMALLELNSGIDSVKISCLGYHSVSLSAQNLPTTIILEKDEVFLEEVTISPDVTAKTSFAGFEKERNAQSLTAFSGLQQVTLIKSPFNTGKRVKSFIFQIHRMRTDVPAALKVIFFKNDIGKPGRKVEVEPIVEINSKIKREVQVNLDSFNIMLPVEGLFAGIEWMGCIDEPKAPDTDRKNCQLAIMINHLDNERIFNQTFNRVVFRTEEWLDANMYRYDQSSVIPVFGLIVYD